MMIKILNTYALVSKDNGEPIYESKYSTRWKLKMYLKTELILDIAIFDTFNSNKNGSM